MVGDLGGHPSFNRRKEKEKEKEKLFK